MPLNRTTQFLSKIALTSILLIFIPTSANAWTTWIGVVEDWPTVTTSASGKQTTYESRVRPIFVKVDQNPWEAAPQIGAPSTQTPLPRTFSWDVCFGGRQEGTLTALMQDKISDEKAPPYVLRETDHAPWRTRRSLDFANAKLEPVYKPIILSSSMNASCKDPEKWKQGNGEKARSQIPSLLKLIEALPEQEKPKELLAEKPTKPMRSWGSKKNGSFVAIKSKIDKNYELVSTFVQKETGAVFLGFSTLMIDAGDFDSDGKTELVFKQRTATGEKYILFNGLEKLAEISF